MMRLVVLCRKCYYENKIKAKAMDRFRLSRKIGEEFELKCPKCGKLNHYTVDDVEAKEGLTELFYFLIVVVITSLSLFILKDYIRINTWGLIPSLIAIPVSFYAVISTIERKKIRAFNRFKLKG
jgi:predicted nucleic-acid-binding Zn-ribbon protein